MGRCNSNMCGVADRAHSNLGLAAVLQHAHFDLGLAAVLQLMAELTRRWLRRGRSMRLSGLAGASLFLAGRSLPSRGFSTETGGNSLSSQQEHSPLDHEGQTMPSLTTPVAPLKFGDHRVCIQTTAEGNTSTWLAEGHGGGGH